ncbi:aldo/keto reductase [Candidatus Hydrogenedentota bacterium]
MSHEDGYGKRPPPVRRWWARPIKSIRNSRESIPQRALAGVGENLSVIGMGGAVVIAMPQEAVNEIVAASIERGVNFFDVAPLYGKGEAEEKLGTALKPFRDKVFLACKTQRRDKAGAQEELTRSLKRLKTDYLDLYQMHQITDVKQDVERALENDGAIPVMLEAKKKGLVRYLGFSSHSVEAALKAMETGVFDMFLHPVNFVCHFHGDFVQKPLEAARKANMGLLGIKPMAYTRWPKNFQIVDRWSPGSWYEPLRDATVASLALRWALSQGITSAIPPGDPRLYSHALNVKAKIKPLDEKELETLKKIALETLPILPGPPDSSAEETN